ncbi:ABC transporter substrate-binding protein [Clostridium sp. LBM24168]
MDYKRVILFFLILVFPFNLVSCSIYSKEQAQQKQINLYVGVKDRESLNIIKILTDFYQKQNPDVKLNINNIIGDRIEDNIGSKNDIIFIDRSDMLNLAQKGLVSDMKNFYKENDIATRYYSVLKIYGRFNDKYYGVPIMPCTLEFLYNKKSFARLKLKPPTTLADFEDVLKKLNSKKIPAILDENMDINNAIFSVVASNNLIPMRKLENIYGSNAKEYEKLPYMQNIFRDIDVLVSSGIINKNTFEAGNEMTIDKFKSGDIPMAMISSYYARNLDNDDIGAISDSLSSMKVPIMADVLMCMPTNGNNSDEAEKFMKFSFNDSMQKQFLKMGYITSNKKVNSKNNGIKKSIASHIKNSSEDNISIIYNIPDEIKSGISSKIDDIFSGKYTGNEWKEILEKWQP